MINQQGYIALISVIIAGSLMTVIGITLTAAAINGLQSSQSRAQSDKSVDAVEGCAEEALLRLRNTATIPPTIATPLATCVITINSQAGTTWDFTTTGTVRDHSSGIRIIAERGTIVTVNSWQQVP